MSDTEGAERDRRAEGADRYRLAQAAKMIRLGLVWRDEHGNIVPTAAMDDLDRPIIPDPIDYDWS